jgi:hypothetical protein
MTRALTVATAIALAAALPPALAAQSQAPPPEQKTEAKAAPSLAGKWDLWVNTEQGGVGSTLDLKVEGTKVTGTMVSERGSVPVQGEVAEGKLKFWITIESNGGSMRIGFNGAPKEDGSLAGTLDTQGYQANWTATRSKG